MNARSKLYIRPHAHPGGAAQLTHSGSSEGSVPLNANWRWQTLYFSDYVSPAHTMKQLEQDQLLLFDIANSHERIGKQVRSDIENCLKF